VENLEYGIYSNFSAYNLFFNNTFMNNTYSGINLTSYDPSAMSAGNQIFNSTFIDNYFGIYMAYSSSTKIYGNNLNNSYDFTCYSNCSALNISNNIFNGYWDAVDVGNSYDINITNNTISGGDLPNKYSIYVWDVSDVDVLSNNINGSSGGPEFYLASNIIVKYNNIFNPYYAFGAQGSDMTFYYNYVENATQCLWIYGTSQNFYILNNTFNNSLPNAANNQYCIRVFQLSNSLIRHNSFYNMTKGIYSDFGASDSNTILNNTFLYNNNGIVFDSGVGSWNTIVNNTFNSSINNAIVMAASSNSIQGNVFIDTALGYYDLNITAGTTSNNIWLNSFYSRGINYSGDSASFCVNEEGNFYADSVPYANIGDGTGELDNTIGGDCGPANLTLIDSDIPAMSAGRNLITWKKQSSQKRINYSLYFSNDTGANWHFLTNTKNLSYNWTTRGMDESLDYSFRLVPFDYLFNATDDNQSFTLDMNEAVCTNETYCEYPNITSALYHENNTANPIYLADPSTTYTLSGTGTYNSAGIDISSYGATLDCNYGKIIGSPASNGITVSANNVVIKKCYIYNYSNGIYLTGVDNATIQYNTIASAVKDLEMASSTNSRISHNSFYSGGVANPGTGNSFCVWDTVFGMNTAQHGNFYDQSIDKSYIESTLQDCGLSNITRPLANANYSTSLNLEWTRQSATAQTINYSVSYSNDFGATWYPIYSTTSTSYIWNISSLPDGNDYLLALQPFDALHNATNATSGYFGIDNTLPSMFIINQTNSSGSLLTSSNPLKSGSLMIINVNASDSYGISSSWIDFWSDTSHSTSVLRSSLGLVSGTVYDGVWQATITLNESLPEMGYINYTVYINDSTTNTVFNDSNFSIVDNEYLCSDYLSCEYTSISDALIGENNTANTIFVNENNIAYPYSGGSGLYRLYPASSRGAIEINASNITLGCGGSTITGNKQAYGIYLNGFSNVTLYDCRFSEYLIGLNISNSWYSNISHVQSYSNSRYGMHLRNVTSGNLNLVNASNNTRDNIFILDSNFTTIQESNVSLSSRAGINVTNSSFNIILSSDLSNNNFSAVYINSLSRNNLITNSTISGSTYESTIVIYGNNNNITGNNFNDAPSDYYALDIKKNALSNSIWLNNFYSGGIKNNGTSTSFCVNTPTHLQNNVYTATSVLASFGNYYSISINSSYAPKGTCGNLTEPFDDSDSDNYRSLIDDCNDLNTYSYPGAPEECDDFDNNCNGQIDENTCNEQFSGSGSTNGGSGGSGGPVGAYSIEGKIIEQSITSNPVVALDRGETAVFFVKGTEQRIKLNKVYFDKVTFSMPSLNKNFTLKLNESLMLDIDNDGANELEIVLSSIQGSTAIFNVRELIVEVKPEVGKTVEERLQEEEARLKAEAEAKAAVQEKPSAFSSIGSAFDFIKGAFKYIIFIGVGAAVLISLTAGAISYSRFMANVKALEDYVSKALESRMSEMEIRQKLIDLGWEPEVVDSIIKMEIQIQEKKLQEANAVQNPSPGTAQQTMQEMLKK
jgi:parallel beta-helix repeat protein